MKRVWTSALAIAFGIGFAVRPDADSVKVKVNFDKDFAFKQAHTWQWNPQGPGQVILARTQMDDREAVRLRAEPVIKEVAAAELRRRGLTEATTTPDLTLTYYLIMTIGTSAQAMGQFLPSVPQWGLPPFSPSTTALEAVERGTLVLDLSAGDRVVWRGLGEAGFSMDLEPKKREALLRDAIKKLFEKYPPKQK